MLNFDNWMEFKNINGRHVLHVQQKMDNIHNQGKKDPFFQ